MEKYIFLIPIFPLLGFLINGASGLIAGRCGREVSKSFTSFFGVVSVLFSFLTASLVFWELLSRPVHERFLHQTLFSWMAVNGFSVSFSFQVDQLSGLMMMIVTGVGFLIHVYSIGYMHHDRAYWRYFAYLNMFVFFMLTLVLADNYLLMFVGWEGVGLASYLLIGFWYEGKENADAGKKAFVVNRVGDFGFALGMFLMFVTFGSLTYQEVFDKAFHMYEAGHLSLNAPILVAICLLLFVGATGKSAQIPLYVWLPDAMAGPTPVSALIHAATMVTAGVYMVARTNVLYSLAPTALMVVAFIAMLTAVFAATIGVLQNDIKRVLAYSTVSQLGYMFIGVGVTAYWAGMFHLMTHAFFKACLFLCSGAVIHALHEIQDMRLMGGLRKYMPVTHITMFIATLAIAGIPPFAGFFSKDEILWKAFNFPYNPSLGRIIWAFGTLGAGITAFYMFRLIFMTFYGKERIPEDVKPHVHEAPPSMRYVLIILAFLSIVGGWIGISPLIGHKIGVPNYLEHFLEPVFERSIEIVQNEVGFPATLQDHHLESILMKTSVLVAIGGAFLAWLIYIAFPAIADSARQSLPILYKVVYNKYYVDEIYEFIFVRGGLWLGNFFWKICDALIIDGLGVNGTAYVIRWSSDKVKHVQNGYVQTYGAIMILGLIVLLTYYMFY